MSAASPIRAALVAAALVALPSLASASPDDVVARPLVLPARSVEAAAVVEIDMSVRRRGEPTSLAPDVWYGVTDELTVGLVHSARALSLVDAGFGYCFRGEEHGCERAYDNVAVEARWSLVAGPLSAALRGRFITRSFDPWKPRLGLGALARWQRGRFAITSDPSLSLGLLNRDRGNRAALDLPLWLAAQPTRRWAVHLRSGVRGTLATFGDTYEIPVAIGTTVSPHRLVDISVEGGLRRALGALNDYKIRSMWVAVTLRWP
jgi:hypothetical protein